LWRDFPDLTEEDVQDEEAEGDVEDEADEPLATGRHRDLYLHDDGLDEDFEELGDEDFLPSDLVDEESLRHAHVKHPRALLTRKVSDELNKGFRSSQQRMGSDKSKAIAEQKQARSLKLRLQGQVCVAFAERVWQRMARLTCIVVLFRDAMFAGSHNPRTGASTRAGKRRTRNEGRHDRAAAPSGRQFGREAGRPAVAASGR
jgi:hypothetical protein